MNEYECALTGTTEEAVESVSADGLDSLPVGWTKITIARRVYNPKWLMIQQVKEAMIEGLMAQMPPDVADIQRYSLVLQVEAQFHAMEKDTPVYVRDVDDVIFLSDSGDIVETINEVRSTLGLDSVSAVPALDSVPEEEDENDVEDDKEEQASSS